MDEKIASVEQHQPNSQSLDCAKMVHSLQVQVASQTLKVIYTNGGIERFRVSTSKNGCSNREASMGTPTGWHQICAKFGEGQETGMVFVGRKPTGRIAPSIFDCEETGDDLITSRILWLDGLEPDVNQGGDCDSKKRHIYIHGTNEEGCIGTPVSHGCIRMINSDVIDLFELVQVGTKVLICKS